MVISMLKRHLNKREVKTLSEITDLEKYMSRDLTFTGNGNNKYTLCPFHREKTPSFCLVTHKSFYYCFGCGASGGALEWAQRRYSIYRDGWSVTPDMAYALPDLLSFNNISIKDLKALAKVRYPYKNETIK
jgi:hypothetical protein